MANFCSTCSNLMITLSTSDTFLFKCVKCEKIQEPSAEDSLILEDKNKVDIVVFKSVLQNAGKDPVNPKVEKKCEKCNYSIVRQVRLGSEMKLVNTCISCNNQWIDYL
jgi:DNA-directed RNA polymerase subunit M/transcription elongation factor TFIIS